MDNSLTMLFNSPFCPTCATLYDPEHYDHVDECARCSNCGTAYKVPADRRPPHPQDPLEHAAADDGQVAALERFRAEAEQISHAMIMGVGCASYEIYALRFSAACAAMLDELDPMLRRHARAIAEGLGYSDDPHAFNAAFGPGVCAVSGIEEQSCHCGRHP